MGTYLQPICLAMKLNAHEGGHTTCIWGYTARRERLLPMRQGLLAEATAELLQHWSSTNCSSQGFDLNSSMKDCCDPPAARPHAHLISPATVQLPFGQACFVYSPWTGAGVHKRCTLRSLDAVLKTYPAHIAPSTAVVHHTIRRQLELTTNMRSSLHAV